MTGLVAIRRAYTLDTIKAAPHGIDLGPLVPRLREVINTASGRIELAPQVMWTIFLAFRRTWRRHGKKQY